MDSESTPKELTRSADPTEGDTVAARKRLRRVSFAETTAVHVFARDEDYETPPDSKPGTEGSPGSGLGSEALGFHGEHTNSDDSRSPPRRGGGGEEEEEADEEDGGDEEHELFVRRDADSSPGSTAGSMTSNDDDNLFGPVSTSFIRSGRLSEVSDDDNHDITLDSTAFSMHFSNVLPSDDQSVNSGGSPRALRGKSVTKGSGGGFTPLLGTKKKIPDFTFPNAKSCGSTGYSSDMTLVAENSNSYDFGKLPPTLEVLLAKVIRTMQPQYPNDHYKSLRANKAESKDNSISEESHWNIDVDASANMAEPHSGKNVEVYGNGESHNRGTIVAPADTVATHTSCLRSCSPNTGTVPPVRSSVCEIDQVIFSPVHKVAKDDVYKANLSSLEPADASKADIISSPSEQPQNNSSLKWDHMSKKHLIDRIGGNENCSKFSHVSASDVPAQKAINADQMSSYPCEGKTQTPIGIQNGDEHMRSPIELSISSLRVKRQRLFDDAFAPLQSRWYSSPAVQTPLSSERKIIPHSEASSIIKTNFSKFENFQMTGSLGSKSRLLSSACDHMSHEFKANLDNSESYNRATPLRISTSEVSEQVMDITAGDDATEMNREMSIHAVESSSKFRKSACDEEIRAISETGKHTRDMFLVPGSGMQKKEKSLSSENPTEGACSFPTSCSSKQIFFVKENRQVLNSYSKLASSPMSLLGQRLSAPQDQCFTPFASGLIKSDSLLKEMRSETPLSCVMLSFSDTTKLDNRNAKPEAGTVSQISWKESALHSVSLGSYMENTVDGGPAVSSLPDAHKKATAIKESGEATEVMHNFVADPSHSRVSDHLGDNQILQAFHLRNTLSQNPMLTAHVDAHQDSYSPQKLLAFLDDDIVGKKGSSKEVPLVDSNMNELGRTPKIQKVMPVIKANISEFSPSQQKQHVVRDSEALGDIAWTDFLTKIIDGPKQPFSTSVNKLNLKELDVLEDLVSEVQKARKYERLSTDMQTLGKNHDLDQKRVSEIISLKERLVYEQAKLQLKSIKHDRLLRRAHELQSRIHDFCKLRSSFMRMSAKQSCLLPVSVPNKPVHDEREVTSSMRQELDILNEKIKGLVKFFETSCNVNGDLGYNEIIKAINDDVDKRNRCGAIRQHLQLWKVVDVVNQNDRCDIVLNYCNLLSQRFTIKVTPASGFSVEVSLKDANIEKRFPNMNASTAFHFVFNGSKGYKRLANLKCFQQEAQVTSFIFGNLLDVLEEIQLSQVENPNLMSSSFCAQSAGELELQLCFLDLKSGRRVALSLDMTYLNCAVYPSELSELKIKVSTLDSGSSESVSDETTGAVRRLKGGHMVLTRLCRCVSQLIQASKK